MCSSSKDDDAKEKSRLLENSKAAVKRRDAENPSVAKLKTYLDGCDGHAIKDISPQFIENVNNVLEKYQNNNYVLSHLYSIVSESSCKSN